MAKLFQLFIISIFLFALAFPATGKEEEEDDQVFGKSISRKSFGLKKEKLSHFRFYWHDVLSGSKPTSMMIIPPPINSTTAFGSMNMIDNALTLGPKLSSKVVGRSQGAYASASQNDVGLMMVMNFVFIDGKYNGSTFAILGRNPVFEKVREMAVIGGSGLFRFARGYVKARTHSWDPRTGDATVQYDAYVLHY